MIAVLAMLAVAVPVTGAVTASASAATKPAAAPPAAAPPAPVSLAVGVTLTTSDMSQALSAQPQLTFSSTAPAGVPIVHVDDGVRYQTIKGMGGAMTDTSAWLIDDELTPAERQTLMASLFGPTGIDLNFLRVPIGASDFTVSPTPYTYDDLPAGQSDPGLSHFSIAHDRAYILPMLDAALKLDPHVFVVGSLWSPPAWMKSNDNPNNLDEAGRLKASDYEPLAQYFVKFLQAYAAAGVHVSAITPANEPGSETTYPGMDLSEQAEQGFVTNYLSPALRTARLGTGIYGYDGGWASANTPFADQLATSSAAHDLEGIATHCYYGAPGSISTLHDADPTLDEIVSECSPGITPYSVSDLLISSIRNWASAVGLWNLALDPRGGPVQAPNHGCPRCSGVVTVNPLTHTFTPTLAYYQLGQVSKFVAPGAVRIGSGNFVRYAYRGPGANIASPGLDDVAFRDPNGAEVLVAYNNSAAPVAFALESSHGHYASYTLAPAATVTFTWDGAA
jgi:glucosylceramidase